MPRRSTGSCSLSSRSRGWTPVHSWRPWRPADGVLRAHSRASLELPREERRAGIADHSRHATQGVRKAGAAVEAGLTEWAGSPNSTLFALTQAALIARTSQRRRRWDALRSRDPRPRVCCSSLCVGAIAVLVQWQPASVQRSQPRLKWLPTLAHSHGVPWEKTARQARSRSANRGFDDVPNRRDLALRPTALGYRSGSCSSPMPAMSLDVSVKRFGRVLDRDWLHGECGDSFEPV